MLRITKLSDPEYLLRQVALGIDEYYLGQGEAPGVWQEGLVGELGLHGVVDAEALRALVLGHEPSTGANLLEGRPGRKVAAFDVTLSAPKSVSLLWAFGSPEVTAIASIAHVEAVSVALDFLERRAGATRQQTDGERQRIPADLAMATFVHRTSREADPQLHSHCVVANLGRRPDGSFAALDAAPLYEWAKATGSIYQEELRRRLTERLGVEWGADRHGCREITGFDDGWLRTFSKRTVAIEEHLAGAGPEHPDPATRMRADDAASLATRPKKDPSLTPERLRERWAKEADDVGLPTGYALQAQVCAREPRVGLTWDDLIDALVDPEEGLCGKRTRFNEAQVVEAVAALGAGRLDAATVEAVAGDFLSCDEAVLLVDRTGRRSPQYSTTAHLAMEERVLSHLEGLVARKVAGVDDALVEGAIAGEHPGLGRDQAEAVRALCAPGPAIRALISPAGFGKTTAIHAACVAASQAGHPVLGLAATHQAASELRDVGLPASTIAAFAAGLDWEGLSPGTVIVLDEVSQVATADAETVLATVAQSAGARLWCLGDPHQAQSVRAGGLGAELARMGEAGVIPAPALTENRRQKDETEREALAHYRVGHVAFSQAIRNHHGLEHDAGSPQATREAMAEAVVADIAAHGAKAVVALAVSHIDCEDMADRIRARLEAAGVLAEGPSLTGPAWAGGERHYGEGDRVLVHGILRGGAQRLHNGSVVTVTGVTDEGLRAQDDRGRLAFLPRAFVEGRRTDGSPNLSHAWARTVDGVQGGTWPQVHLLGTAALERFTGYVGQSRSRLATHTWNVTRLPEVDFRGHLAEERTPDREVLDAMLRIPDTGFAAHDGPGRIRRLMAERAEHQRVLATRPRDPGIEVRQAEEALRAARYSEDGARYRKRIAEGELDRMGPLSSLRRYGRHRKAELTSRIDRFEGDITQATGKVRRLDDQVEGLHQEAERTEGFDAEHGWRNGRVSAIEAELGIRDRRSEGRDPLDDLLANLADLDRARSFERSRGLGHDDGLGMGLEL